MDGRSECDPSLAYAAVNLDCPAGAQVVGCIDVRGIVCVCVCVCAALWLAAVAAVGPDIIFPPSSCRITNYHLLVPQERFMMPASSLLLTAFSQTCSAAI